MYIIKHRSRRASDAQGTFYWVVCGTFSYRDPERAVDALFDTAGAFAAA